jgi:hypothetical protein
MTDRVWSTLPDTPRKPFGSALSPVTDGRIVTPALITEPTKRITRRELRKAIDGEEA